MFLTGVFICYVGLFLLPLLFKSFVVSKPRLAGFNTADEVISPSLSL